jgi:hypothetical protein
LLCGMKIKFKSRGYIYGTSELFKDDNEFWEFSYPSPKVLNPGCFYIVLLETVDDIHQSFAFEIIFLKLWVQILQNKHKLIVFFSPYFIFYNIIILR